MTLRAMVAMVLLLVLGMPVEVDANGRHAVRKQMESSLQVSGTITVSPDGTVATHSLDPKAPLGEELTRFIAGTVAQWRFKPVEVDGKVVAAKVPMHLRLIAKPRDNGEVAVRIASTYFGSNDTVGATDVPRGIRLTPPQYPTTALQMGGKGTAYLIVQVGRDGRVANVDAEQVNLRVIGNERQMVLLRKQFSDAAVRAARTWTFAVPSTGETANDDLWLVRVPVQFSLDGDAREPKEGDWDAYIPGPRNTHMPWAAEKLRMAGSPDALPGNGVYPLQQGATLLTPPAT